MTTERSVVGFDTEYPLYSGLYRSIIQYIDIDDIVSPEKPVLGAPVVSTFSRSLSERGFLRPIYITRNGVITDGRKRYAAARALGAKRIPCVTSPTPLVFEDDLLILRLRTEQVPFFESADVLAALTGSYLYSREDVAAALGRSRSFVANRLRLLAFTYKERALIEENSLSERHCRAFLRIKDADARLKAIETAAASSMSVADAEEFVSSFVSCGAVPDGARLRREIDTLLGSYSDKIDLYSSSTVAPDGSIVFTIRIPR